MPEGPRRVWAMAHLASAGGGLVAPPGMGDALDSPSGGCVCRPQGEPEPRVVCKNDGDFFFPSYKNSYIEYFTEME